MKSLASWPTNSKEYKSDLVDIVLPILIVPEPTSRYLFLYKLGSLYSSSTSSSLISLSESIKARGPHKNLQFYVPGALLKLHLAQVRSLLADLPAKILST